MDLTEKHRGPVGNETRCVHLPASRRSRVINSAELRPSSSFLWAELTKFPSASMVGTNNRLLLRLYFKIKTGISKLECGILCETLNEFLDHQKTAVALWACGCVQLPLIFLTLHTGQRNVCVSTEQLCVPLSICPSAFKQDTHLPSALRKKTDLDRHRCCHRQACYVKVITQSSFKNIRRHNQHLCSLHSTFKIVAKEHAWRACKLFVCGMSNCSNVTPSFILEFINHGPWGVRPPDSVE